MLPLRTTSRPRVTPVVTYVFIAANILVYFLWQQGGLSLGTPDSAHYVCQLCDWAAIPYELTHPGDQVQIAPGCGTDNAPTWVTPFTAMFMHGGLLHLGGNMLFLWIFGNNVEDSMGPVRFVVFYVLGGLAATRAAGRHRRRTRDPDARRLGRDRRGARRLRRCCSRGPAS